MGFKKINGFKKISNMGFKTLKKNLGLKNNKKNGFQKTTTKWV